MCLLLNVNYNFKRSIDLQVSFPNHSKPVYGYIHPALGREELVSLMRAIGSFASISD
jgi:hypothetical protein